MTLVTAATGNVGRQVVSQLLRTGATVSALTRNPDSAALPADVDSSWAVTLPSRTPSTPACGG